MTSPLPCIDIGANLTNRQFRGELQPVLDTAREAGVAQIILTGTSLAGSREAAEICEAHPGILYATAGIHPHDARHFDGESRAELSRLYQMPQVVAVGECGLDFNRDFSPRDAQADCFAAQLELAGENQRPLFLHERDAHEAFTEMMRACRDRISRGVVHCFTGTAEEAKTYLDLDLHLGITGWICDERRGAHLRDVVREIPVERLMIETDAPYLAPRDLRPRVKRNEPKYLPHILRSIAACRGEDPAELAEGLLTTTRAFFSLA